MGLYGNKYKNNATDANVISSSFKLPKGMYPKDLISKLHSITGENYGANLVSKSKYTVRYSLFGVAFGAAMAMYFKKSILGGCFLGALTGTGIGYAITKYKDAIALKDKEAAALAAIKTNVTK